MLKVEIEKYERGLRKSESKSMAQWADRVEHRAGGKSLRSEVRGQKTEDRILSSIQYRVSSIEYPVSCIQHQATSVPSSSSAISIR